MTLGIAVLLLVLAAAGIALSLRFLQSRPKLRILCIVLLSLAALALAAYIGLTLFFVDAVGHQPPAV